MGFVPDFHGNVLDISEVAPVAQITRSEVRRVTGGLLFLPGGRIRQRGQAVIAFLRYPRPMAPLAVNEQLAEVPSAVLNPRNRGHPASLAVHFARPPAGDQPPAAEHRFFITIGGIRDRFARRPGVLGLEHNRLCEVIRPPANKDGDSLVRPLPLGPTGTDQVASGDNGRQRSVGLVGLRVGQRARPIRSAIGGNIEACCLGVR